VSVLTNLLETTPGGYRANDARFLIGAIYWRQSRAADAVAMWSQMTTIDSADRYSAASAEILDAIRTPQAQGRSLDARRIFRILDGERGRWVSFSHDRLTQFGYRFNIF
jgi:hypothetical protein